MATQGIPDDMLLDLSKSEPAQASEKRWGQLVSLNPSYNDFDLEEPLVQIGRKSNCQLRFTEKFISKVHCSLILERLDPKDPDSPTVVYLEDLSSNGTFVNGNLVGQNKKVHLNDQDEISFVKAPAPSPISYMFRRFETKKGEAGGVFDKYTIGDVLGQGNFATVKLATNKSTGKKFACKVIDKKKYFKQAGSRKEKLMDEVEILKKISHPGVIKIEDVYDTEKTLYIILELVTGGELFDAINEVGHYSEEQAKQLFRQLLNVVDFLHDQGIVHRDLKPENILFATKEKKELKLSDFGLSRVIGEGSVMQTMCGTPQYIAPEILNNSAEHKGYGKLVDCWSLGAILFVLLSGEMPFDDSAPNTTVFDAIRAGKVSFNGAVWEDISIEAKDLIKSLLCVDPTTRYDCKKAMKHPWLTGSGMEELMEQRKREEVESKKKKQLTEDLKKKSSADQEKKRKREEEEGDEARPVCKYGASCYRKNPQHLKEFRHPHKEAVPDSHSDSGSNSNISLPKNSEIVED